MPEPLFDVPQPGEQASAIAKSALDILGAIAAFGLHDSNRPQLRAYVKAGREALALADAKSDRPTCVCTGSGWPHVPSSDRCTPPVDPRRAARAADPHAHACVSCSPDGVLPGSGCVNCRQTGMDQTPCTALGHTRQCPHGCCGGPRTANSAPNRSDPAGIGWDGTSDHMPGGGAGCLSDDSDDDMSAQCAHCGRTGVHTCKGPRDSGSNPSQAREGR